MNGSRRAVVIGAILAILAAGGLLDRESRPEPAAPVLPPVPMAAAADARSSAWYCTGATAARDGVADGTVAVLNTGDRALRGTVTVYPSQGDTRQVPVDVGPAGRAVVRLADVASAPFASALVELDGGDAVVELAGSGSLGEGVTACATAASQTWFFADGVTTRDATEILTLFNPFPDDAVVDLSFGTDEGQVTPQGLTGLSVRGGAMSSVNVGEFVQRRSQVTAAIRARTGRLVVGRIQSFDGTDGRKGMSMALGAASPAELWYVPEGIVTDGVTERYQIYNPGGDEAEVEVELALEQGEAEPLELSVPAESRVTVEANEEPRIPKGVPHSATVRSLNGVRVVVERTVDLTSGRRTGTAATGGSQVTARRWAMAWGAADDSSDEVLVFLNPGVAGARVTVTVLADGQRQVNDALRDLEVAAGQRRSVRLGDSVKRNPLPVLVEADQPIVVERTLNRVQGTGLSMSIGIPLRG